MVTNVYINYCHSINIMTQVKTLLKKANRAMERMGLILSHERRYVETKLNDSYIYNFRELY